MEDKKFGTAGNTMVIEEFMTGREVSVLSFVGCIFCSIWLFKYSKNNCLSFIPSGLVGSFTIIIFIGQRGNKDIEISDSEEAELNMIHRK